MTTSSQDAPRRRWGHIAAQSVMAVLFVMAAAVQHNDPDPLAWILIYLGAAVVCVLAALEKIRWEFQAALAAVSLVWSAWLASRVLGQQPIFDEEGREMMGLALIGAWAAISVVWARAVARRKGSKGGEA